MVKHIFQAIAIAILAVALAWAAFNFGGMAMANASMRTSAEALEALESAAGTSQAADLPAASDGAYPYECIVVLGASVLPDGSLSDMLQSRVDAAIDLYFAGAAPVIVMSGNGVEDDYDEPAAMKRYAIEQGVPEDAILCDDGGLHTFDTMWRLANVGGYGSAVVVTQEYHLYRTVLDAQAFDIEVLGVSCDSARYENQWYYELREIPARLNDFWQVISSAGVQDQSSLIEA